MSIFGCGPLQAYTAKQLRERLKELDDISSEWAKKARYDMGDAIDAIEQASCIREELERRRTRYVRGVTTREIIVL